MNSRTKKMLIYGVAIIGSSIGAFLLLRKREIEFFDNIWCEGENCGNIDDAIAYCSGGRTTDNTPFNEGDLICDGDVGMGYLNLIFPEKHGLKEGQKIDITQNDDAVYPYYDGRTVVLKVINDYIIRTDKAFKGDSPSIGGKVIVDSIINNFLSE